MHMNIVNITPSMAASWLETSNNSNRLLSAVHVAKYASDMMSGHWRQTHQNAIAFYENGNIADGQHRLAAIVKAGIPVNMYVAYGLSQQDGSVIDQGRVRSLTDALRIGGLISSKTYASHRVAVAKFLRAMETGSNSAPSIFEVAEILQKIDPQLDPILKIMGSSPRSINTAPVRSALVVACSNMEKEKVLQITRVLVSGMPEIPLDETVVRLRNWLIQYKTTGRGERISVYLTCLRAFKAYSAGETLKHIKRTSTVHMTAGLFNG